MLRILSVLLLLAPLTARADSADVEARLQRIERRLDALERTSLSLMGAQNSKTLRSGETVKISAEDFKRYSENIPLLLTRVRGVPSFDQGQAIGLRLFAVKAGDFFDQIGLQNNDVVISVDSTPVLDVVTLVRTLTPPPATISKPITIQLKRLDLPISIHVAVGATDS